MHFEFVWAEVHHSDFRPFFEFFMIVWNCNPSKDSQLGNACKPVNRFTIPTSRSYGIQQGPGEISLKMVPILD